MPFIEHPHYETKAGQIKNEIRTRLNSIIAYQSPFGSFNSRGV